MEAQLRRRSCGALDHMRLRYSVGGTKLREQAHDALVGFIRYLREEERQVELLMLCH